MEARETNLVLDNIKAQIIKYYQRISNREAYATVEMVRYTYQRLGDGDETLLGTFYKENKVFKNVSEKTESGLFIWQGYGQENMWHIHQITLHTRRYGVRPWLSVKGCQSRASAVFWGIRTLSPQTDAKITVQNLDSNLTMLGHKLSKSFGNVKLAEI